MNNAVITFPMPANEPVKTYLEGSPERIALEKELERQSKIVSTFPSSSAERRYVLATQAR